MTEIIAVSIAVIGWFVNHFLSNRAQKKHFTNQLRNKARIEITTEIKCYLNWLGELNKTLEYLRSMSYQDIPEWSKEQNKQLKKLDEKLYDEENYLSWYEMIIEYEALYPETFDINKYFKDQHQLIMTRLKGIKNYIQHPNRYNGGIDELEKGLIKLIENIDEQINLLLDMNLYLQNSCLSKISGYKAPNRIPEWNKYPELIINKKNMLMLKGNNKTIV
jgi:hypothetical protein